MKTRIEKYINGDLSNAERHALEKEALNDPFLADAIEGFEIAGSTAIAGSAQKAIEEKFSGGTSWAIKGLIGGAIVLACASAFFLLNDREDKIVSGSNSPVSTADEITELALGEINENTSGSEEEIDVQNIPQGKQEKVLVVEEDLIPENKFEFNEAMVTVKTLDLDRLTDPASTPMIEPELKKVRGSNMDLDYFFHMKVVDYDEVSRKAIMVNKTLEHGTPAYMENQDTDNGVSINFDKENWVPYMEYLEGSMKHVSKGRNKLALKNFDVIFEHYPEDANAQFYSGLCNFYLKRYDQGIIHFDAVADNKINTFHEEADWHKLLCFKALGEKEFFDDLKVEIIDLGGFYAERAKVTRFK